MSKSSPKRNYIIATVLFSCAVVLTFIQFSTHVAVFLHVLSLKIERPKDSSFPEYQLLLTAAAPRGRVDYAQLKNSELLTRAVTRLESFSPDGIKSPRERLCFWINAYNLLAIKEIADRFPIASVKQLGNDIPHRKFLIGGVLNSLQDIYLNEIMPLLKSEDPKAAFLICGGAIGQPALLSHAINSSSLDRDSAAAAKEFIGKGENVSYNIKHNIILLSPWFQSNEMLFQHKYGCVERLIDSYLSAEQRKIFDDPAITKLYGRKFDWRINDAQRVK